MKRILSVIAAGALALLMVSCAKEEKAVVDFSQATPPSLVSAQVGDNLLVQYNPAVFRMDFNKKMATFHTLALVSIDGKESNVNLSAKDDGSTLSVTGKSITALLKNRGYKMFDTVTLEVVVRGSIQDPSRGITNGFVDSREKYSFSWTLPEEVENANPYEEYTEASPWTVIGALSAYGINWDGDLNMWTDGNGNHVAAHVTLDAADEFKFRKDQAWTENMGGEFGGLDAEFAVAQDGANIKVGVSGVYDIFFSENGVAWISPAFDPYPDYTEASTWTVIGALSAYGINWDGDLPMITDGASHVALSVSIAAADEFKFRKDQAWTENMGGEFGGVDTEFAVTQDGANIKVGADGVFDLFLNPDAGTATVATASGAKVSSKLGGDEPAPPTPTVTGWNIIGLNGDWDNDVLATEADNVWTAYITANEATTFKWRKDGAWDENYGGTMEALGQPFAAEAGGSDIAVEAGFYKVVLDLNELTITVSDGNVFSLIGEINGDSWSTDVIMEEHDGVWTSPLVFISGGFKIRHNFSWADEDTYGVEDGFTPVAGVVFTAVQPGSNISMAGGNYTVRFNPETLEVLIQSVDYDIPEIDLSQYEVLDVMAGAESWGIIGPAQSGGWDTDTDLQKIQDEPEIWAVMNIALQADKFKFRGNDTWGDYDLGGGTWVMNEPIVMTKGGSDMSVERGVYTVYLYPTYGIAYFTEGSGDVPPPPAKPTAWSLIGTLNGTAWDTDFDLTNTSGDKWEIKNVALTADDEFKIRADYGWNTSVGGPEENATSTIDESNPYGVYKPVLGTAFAAGDKNIQVGVAGNYNVIFDYAAQTILIEEYKEFPEQLYMIGAEFGGWNWDSDGVVEMTPVLHNPDWGAEAEGQFYTVRYFTAGEGFKFCAQRAWNGDFWGLDNNDGFTESGGNCTVSESGFYLVHIDFKASKVHVEPARVYGIGDAFGGWDEEMESARFKAEGKTLKATVASAGNLRIYVASAIATSGWWTREFSVIDGTIVPRLMDELPAVSVKAGQVVSLDLNAGTGSIEGEGEAPAFKAELTVAGSYSGSGWSPENDPKLAGDEKGLFKGALVMQGGEFKFVHDNAWIGGTAEDLVYTLNIGGGDNMTIADGTYFWTVDLAAETPVATALAIEKLGLIGSFNGWAEDVELAFDAESLCYSGSVTLEEGAEFKIRFNGNWDYALGGSADKLSAFGDNIKVAEAGTYTAVVNLNKGVITLSK